MRVAALLVLTACAACAASARPGTPPRAVTPPGDPAAPAAFPLAVGKSWTYEGTVRWTDARARADRQQQVSWTAEVVDKIDRGPVVAWLFKGFPGDLVWSEGEAQRGDWVLIQDGNRFYLDRATDDLVDRLRHAGNARALIDPRTLLFELPLAHGQKLCKNTDEPRYCWEVTANGPAFDLTYRTNPDHTVIQITPGVGITAYDYVHHGTTAEVHLKLTVRR